jgi:hypothetical protein
MRSKWRVDRWKTNKERIWKSLNDDTVAEITKMTLLFPQVPFWDFVYLYRYRNASLLMCAERLDDTTKCGKDWLFFATGAIKQNYSEVCDRLKNGMSLYQWLRYHTSAKKVLSSSNTKCKISHDLKKGRKEKNGRRKKEARTRDIYLS